MKPLPDISAAEWDVMKIVWAHGPLTSGQVVRHLSHQRHWKPRTIKTLLARLVRKGAVAGIRKEKQVLYSAKVGRERLARREATSFLDRVFDGAVAPALIHLVQGSELSSGEIAELKAILDREAQK